MHFFKGVMNKYPQKLQLVKAYLHDYIRLNLTGRIIVAKLFSLFCIDDFIGICRNYLLSMMTHLILLDVYKRIYRNEHKTHFDFSFNCFFVFMQKGRAKHAKHYERAISNM